MMHIISVEKVAILVAPHSANVTLNPIAVHLKKVTVEVYILQVIGDLGSVFYQILVCPVACY